MDDSALAQLLTADPNTLPYFIIERATKRIVPVEFAPLAEADIAELRGDAWADAVFREVWPGYVGEARTLKLICSEEADTAIQGLVRLGQVVSGGALRKSLLETAPCNRREARPSRYHGAGRVLIARLVVESYRQGAGGQVTVRARLGSEGFYEALGFRGSPFSPHTFALFTEEAKDLLQRVLRSLEKRAE